MAYIFDFSSYKKFLSELCSQQRGLLTRLSEAAQVQKSYLSACLNGKGQITLDHAYGMGHFLGLTDNEQTYFFLLIETDKAVTPGLKKVLSLKLKEMSREAYRLKNQQNDSIIISDSNTTNNHYYLNWLYVAIHSLTSITNYQTPEKISERLNVTLDTVQEILKHLTLMSFTVNTHKSYKWNTSNIHLEDGSSILNAHHSNWRLRALDNCYKADRTALHYSAVQSMSIEDFDLLKMKIAQFIKGFNKTADPSRPEESFCLNIDFFKI